MKFQPDEIDQKDQKEYSKYINQQIAHKRNSPSYRKMLSQLVCARKNTAHKTVSVQ
jgi:hypothetical protein